MKKKIILLVLCAVLLLIFTSSSYGGFDPKCKTPLLARPEQELKSPPNRSLFDNVLLVIVPNWNSFSLLLCGRSDSLEETPTMQSLTSREVGPRANKAERVR